MFWKLMARNSLYLLVILSGTSLWLLATESGFQTSLSFIQSILPGTLSLEKTKGTWLTQHSFHHPSYESNAFKITAEILIFSPEKFSLGFKKQHP